MCSLTDASHNGKLKLCRKYETAYELILAYIFAKIYYGQLSAMHSSYFQVQLSDWLYERHFTAFFRLFFYSCSSYFLFFLLILPTFYFLIIMIKLIISSFFLVYLQYDDVCLFLYHFALKQLKNMAHLFFEKSLKRNSLSYFYIVFHQAKVAFLWENITSFACLCKKKSLEK